MRSPSDFGFNGGLPSHPELLDWLATEFMANGWRPKYIHRLILLSSTYRQSSRINPQAATVDRGNTLLWRFSPRRLDAEPIRDSILSVSGALDLKMGGPGFDVFEPNGNYVKVYVPKQAVRPGRMATDDLSGTSRGCSSTRRSARSTVPTRPSPWPNAIRRPRLCKHSNCSMVRSSSNRRNFLRRRLGREAPGDVPRQIKRAFWLAFGRRPTPRRAARRGRLISREGLPIFCRAMLNANELIYLP